MPTPSRTIIFLLAILFCSSALAQTNPALSKHITAQMDSADIIGAQVLIMKNGNIDFFQPFGYRSLEDSSKVDHKTLFMMASCSKPVTALAMLSLVDKGKAKLDDPISKYLPFKFVNPYFPDEPITIRHLMTHTSGIKDNWDFLDATYTHESGGGDSPISLDSMARNYFMPEGEYYKRKENYHGTKPGDYLNYSNIGFAMVGYIVEQITGRPFNKYCREEIFEPLGMNSTWWMLKEIPHKNIARPHEGGEVLPHYGYVSYPDGQLRTTAKDYLTFMQLLMNDGKSNGQSFISKATVDEFLKIQFPFASDYQALGWNYHGVGNRKFYETMPDLPGHNGGDPGVSTWLFFDREAKSAVIFLMNSGINSRGTYISILKILRRLAEEAGMSKK